MYSRLCLVVLSLLFFFFKQKTAYEMRISDWSSDVCSSDLEQLDQFQFLRAEPSRSRRWQLDPGIGGLFAQPRNPGVGILQIPDGVVARRLDHLGEVEIHQIGRAHV